MVILVRNLAAVTRAILTRSEAGWHCFTFIRGIVTAISVLSFALMLLFNSCFFGGLRT